MAAKLIPINSEQFESALKIRDLTNREIETALGRADGYISTMKRRGSINLPDAKMIETFYDIPMEEYVSKEKCGKEGRHWCKNVAIDGEKLRALIKETGMVMSKFSIALGHSHSYINRCVVENIISSKTAEHIQALFNIPMEEYVIDKMKKKDPFPIVIEDDPKEELDTNDNIGQNTSYQNPKPDLPTEATTNSVSVNLNEWLEKHPEETTDISETEPENSQEKESDEIFQVPGMPIFVNITINVDARPIEANNFEIDYRRLKSDTYNAVCTGVFDGMARWNRR